MAILVFGGSGMLIQASQWLHKQALTNNEEIIFCSRSSKPYGDLLHKDLVEFIEFDYKRVQSFCQLSELLKANAITISTLLAWIHSPYEPLFIDFLNHLNQPQPFTVYAVKGSSSRPSKLVSTHQYQVHFIQLGRHPSGRWLSHNEISDGTVQAIKDGRSVVVGDLPA